MMERNDPSTWDAAACRTKESARWFAPMSEVEERAAAKATCARCPVQPDCLAYALEHNIAFGIWGGLTERERRRLRRRAAEIVDVRD